MSSDPVLRAAGLSAILFLSRTVRTVRFVGRVCRVGGPWLLSATLHTHHPNVHVTRSVEQVLKLKLKLSENQVGRDPGTDLIFGRRPLSDALRSR